MANGSTRKTRTIARSSSVENIDPKKSTRSRSSSTNTVLNPPEIGEPNPLQNLLAKFKLKSKEAIRKSKNRSRYFKQAVGTIKRYGVEAAVSKDIAFYDAHVLQVVLEAFNRGKKWDIQLTSEYLPPIIANVPDRICGSACVQSLDIITSKLLASIQTASRSRPSLGVDIAAEERKEQADTCLEKLRDLRNNKKIPVMKISEEVSVQLHDVLERLLAI